MRNKIPARYKVQFGYPSKDNQMEAHWLHMARLDRSQLGNALMEATAKSKDTESTFEF